MIDINVTTESLTTGLVKSSGTKRPPSVAWTQWCKYYQRYQDYNLVRQTLVSSSKDNGLPL